MPTTDDLRPTTGYNPPTLNPWPRKPPRIEAFSDGVYAIAITLLILDLKVPMTQDGHLGAALLRQWPTYFAFLVSFAFIGIMWVNHHRLFNHIRKSDNRLLFLNLLLLLGVTFVPFPTALLAAHLRGADARVAAAVFNGTYVLIAIFFNVLWHHAVDHALLDSATLDSAHSISAPVCGGSDSLSRLFCTHVGERAAESGFEHSLGGVLRCACSSSQKVIVRGFIVLSSRVRKCQSTRYREAAKVSRRESD